MIEALIFDYGNVIEKVDYRSFLECVALDVIDAVDPFDSRGAVLQVAHETGAMSSDTFAAAVIETYALDISCPDFLDAYSNILTPIASTVATIRRLAGRYQLALLSNTNTLHYENAIARSEILPLFDAVVLSHLVGYMKPDPRIYADILGKLQVPAQTCVFIDDRAANIEAAELAGMQTIHLTKPSTLAPDLAKLGVE
jgi:putative hydrolase of the HAD superfamily